MLLPVELYVNGIIQYACFWVWLLSTHCYVWKVHPCCNVCCSLLSFPYHCLTVVQFVSAFYSWWTSGLCLGFLSYKLLLWAFCNPFLGATWTIVSPENNSHALFIALRFFLLHRYAFFFFFFTSWSFVTTLHCQMMVSIFSNKVFLLYLFICFWLCWVFILAQGLWGTWAL